MQLYKISGEIRKLQDLLDAAETSECTGTSVFIVEVE